MRIVCVIMASGEGKRFGGNKLLASFRGAPLYHGILKTTAPLFEVSPRDLLVVTRHMEIAAWCRENGVRVLLHDLLYGAEHYDTQILLIIYTKGGKQTGL